MCLLYYNPQADGYYGTYVGLKQSRPSFTYLDHHFYLLSLTAILLFRWEKPGHSPRFGYDFWYQPRHKTMISSSWGAPLAFTKGFNPSHVADGLYGQHLFVYDWPEGTLKQTLNLGNTGLIPLEVWFINHWLFWELRRRISYMLLVGFHYDEWLTHWLVLGCFFRHNLINSHVFSDSVLAWP